MNSRPARLVAAPAALIALALSATTLNPFIPEGGLDDIVLKPKPGERAISYQVLAESSENSTDNPASTSDNDLVASVGEVKLSAEKSAPPHTTTAQTEKAKEKPAKKPPPKLPVPKSFGEWIASPSRVLIDQSERRLYFKKKDGGVDSAPIAVGRDGYFTPNGQFHITQVRRNPSWFPTPSMKKEAIENGERLPNSVPPGPNNPLGRYFIRFKPEYGIHGTNEPNSIGQAISRGCVRMHNKDVTRLAKFIKVGDPITIVKRFDLPVTAASAVQTIPAPQSEPMPPQAVDISNQYPMSPAPTVYGESGQAQYSVTSAPLANQTLNPAPPPRRYYPYGG